MQEIHIWWMSGHNVVETMTECEKTKFRQFRSAVTKQDLLSSIELITCTVFWTSWNYNKKIGNASHSATVRAAIWGLSSWQQSTKRHGDVVNFVCQEAKDGVGRKVGNLKEISYFDLEMQRCTIASWEMCICGEVVFALQSKTCSFWSFPFWSLTQLHASSQFAHDLAWQQLELRNKKALSFCNIFLLLLWNNVVYPSLNRPPGKTLQYLLKCANTFSSSTT